RQICDDLQQRSHVEVNATRSDLPFLRIVLIDPTTRKFDERTGRSVTGEWPLVVGFKTEFNCNHPRPEDHVLHEVVVSRERSDKRTSELITDGFIPLHEHARNLKHHI